MPFPTLDALVGNRPLVQIQRLPGNAGERGEIRPGDTLIEATSGNTGMAPAMVATCLRKIFERERVDRIVITVVCDRGDRHVSTGLFS